MSTPSLLAAVLPDLTEIEGPQPVVATLTPIQPQAPPEAATVTAEPAKPWPKRKKTKKT